MLYEIVNMSDPYTIEAQSLDVAMVACVFLGGGQYALRPITDEKADGVPFFMFGGGDEWCRKRFGEDMSVTIRRVLAEKRDELADCLESCVIGREEDRAAYFAGLELIDDPKKREKWRARWLDKRRSSLNNIGGRAFALAAKVRVGAMNPLAGNEAPKQVFAR